MKLPKQFGTKKAQILVDQIEAQEREFISNLLTVPDTDWIKLIDELKIEQEHKDDMKKQLDVYVKKLEHPRDLDPAYRVE